MGDSRRRERWWRSGRLNHFNSCVFDNVRNVGKKRDRVEDDWEERVVFRERVRIGVEEVDGGVEDNIFAMTYLAICTVGVHF